MLIKVRALCAAVSMALACAVYTTDAHAQASQIPPGEVCFQATTGINGMIGSLGAITGGSGGTTGTYGGVALTGGTGSGATANITVSGGKVTGVALLNPGVGYITSDVLSALAANIGNVTGFSVPVASTSINSSLAGGTIGMYIPGTLTTKQTWQNAAETVLNTNPVKLDLNGCALMYGTGIYRQIVYDSLGNEVWDQLTTVPTPNPVYVGLVSGSANSIALVDGSFSQTDGQSITFLALQTNTGPTTVSVSGGSPIPIVKNTSGGPVPLTGSEIVGGTPGNIYTITYSATYAEFFIGFTS